MSQNYLSNLLLKMLTPGTWLIKMRAHVLNVTRASQGRKMSTVNKITGIALATSAAGLFLSAVVIASGR